MPKSSKARKIDVAPRKVTRGAVRPVAAPPPVPAEAWSEGSLSVRSAAEILERSTRTVFKLMDEKRLRWGRLGRERRIPKVDVLRLLSGE